VSGAAALAVRGLTKRFGDVLALDGVDLEVEAGEFVSVIGPSGCGKSTLFAIIAGLSEPTAGEVLVDGRRGTRRVGEVAYMPQKDLLFPWRRVIDNATLGLEVAGVPRREARRRAEPLLERFGLGGFARAWPDQLSGGMRQRAAFLRTVLQDRPAMLLDEPFGALDGLTRADLQGWLLEVWDELRPTVVLVTHDVAEAVLLSDRVYVMTPRPGRIGGVVEVDLPRPRPPAVQEGERFADLERELRRLLRQATEHAAPPARPAPL
jgi:ABC-type nitrate/sulfonate/bicarbonate transport system ATPase subunit